MLFISLLMDLNIALFKWTFTINYLTEHIQILKLYVIRQMSLYYIVPIIYWILLFMSQGVKYSNCFHTFNWCRLDSCLHQLLCFSRDFRGSWERLIVSGADTRASVSSSEIGVKAEQVDTLMGFVNCVLCTFGEMTSVNLRKVPRRFCKAILPGETAACDAYPHGDRKRGLAKARTDIYFVDPRAFANDIPFEMESPPESVCRIGPGQVDAHVYVRVHEERNSCQSPSASNGKETVTIKIPGNEDTRHDDLLRASPSSLWSGCARTILHFQGLFCISNWRNTYRML